MNTWEVVSLIGDEEAISRTWQADDAAHAEEQHRNAFPEEDFVAAFPGTRTAHEIKKECERTLPEALDAARNGAEFGQILQGLFASLEKAIDNEREKEA